MPNQKMYTMQFYGDLPTKAPHLCKSARVFLSIDDALKWLLNHLVKDWENSDSDDEFAHFNTENKFWFDPEDDRIVIWEISSDNEFSRVVWQASGWHWPHDASDLPGGPLEQGKLPGDIVSLYEHAISE